MALVNRSLIFRAMDKQVIGVLDPSELDKQGG